MPASDDLRFSQLPISSLLIRSLVRRIVSISLLLMFSLPLISPLFAARTAEANLPACCRRVGKHHCIMSQTTSSDGRSIQVGAVRERCPSYPATPVTPHLDLSLDEVRARVFAGVIGLETCIAQTEARYRISFDRSRQKRGPPGQVLTLS